MYLDTLISNNVILDELRTVTLRSFCFIPSIFLYHTSLLYGVNLCPSFYSFSFNNPLLMVSRGLKILLIYLWEKVCFALDLSKDNFAGFRNLGLCFSRILSSFLLCVWQGMGVEYNSYFSSIIDKVFVFLLLGFF